jgi:hypothetical protein
MSFIVIEVLGASLVSVLFTDGGVLVIETLEIVGLLETTLTAGFLTADLLAVTLGVLACSFNLFSYFTLGFSHVNLI